MAAPNSVLSTTLRILAKKLQDNSFVSHPLFRAIEEAGNIRDYSGGSSIDVPVILGQQSSDTYQLTTGWESTPLVFNDPYKNASFAWCDAVKQVAMNLVEVTSNKGELAQVNILESKVRNAMINMKQDFARRVFQGPVDSSNPLTNLQTFNGMTTAASTGWFEGVAQASQDNVVGGISKVTYQSDNWFNQFQDAGGTLTVSDIDTLMINCQIYNPAGAPPDLIFLSPKAYSAFLSLIQSQVQYISVRDAAGLRDQMVPTWRGARIYVEPTLGFTAEAPAKAVSGYVLTSTEFSVYRDLDAWFTLRDQYQVSGTVVMASTIHTRMQLTTGRLACHGVLLDAEA